MSGNTAATVQSAMAEKVKCVCVCVCTNVSKPSITIANNHETFRNVGWFGCEKARFHGNLPPLTSSADTASSDYRLFILLFFTFLLPLAVFVFVWLACASDLKPARSIFFFVQRHRWSESIKDNALLWSTHSYALSVG